MKYDFKNLTIKKQLTWVFVIFVVLAVLNFIALHHFINQTEVTRKKTLTAEKLPELAENIFETAKNVEDHDEASKKAIQKRSSELSLIVNTFLEGGKLPQSETFINSLNGKSKQELQHLKVLWDSIEVNLSILRFDTHTLDTIKQDVVEVPNYDSLNTTHTEVVDKVVTIDNPTVVKAKSFVSDNSTDLDARIDSFILEIEANHKLANELLNYAILIIVVLNFIVVATILLGIRKMILKPITQLDSITERLSTGHFDVSDQFEWRNEISHVGDKIRQLGMKLKNATEFVKQVGKGELDNDFKGVDTASINESGLEAALLNMRDQMKQVEQEEEIRKWSTGGLAKFVDILRSSNDDVNDLCDKIISNLVEYTHSNQGGLYLLNDDDSANQHLELISMYAFNTKKFDTKTYRLGEGLVGQTFLERKTTYLLEIPNEYIAITSGLGGANPKAILVVPLQVNKDIFGILELASFEEYKTHEIEFIEKLGESIASTIASVKNNQRTKRLLEESQELTEQMQAQEEEMRQNMEELSATQEEMARKEIEITAQLTAINNSLGTIEYDIEGTITNCNDIFAAEMGYTSEKLFDNAFTSIYADDRNIWPSLKSGTAQTGSFSFKMYSEKTINLECSFTPIKNDEGEIYKIIQLVTQFGVNEATTKEPWEGEVEAALRQNLEELEITQEQLNAKLKYAQEKLDTINDQVKIITIDSDLNILEINQAFSKETGHDLESLKGQAINIVIDKTIEGALKDKLSTVTGDIIDVDSNTVTKQLNLIHADAAKGSKITHILWV